MKRTMSEVDFTEAFQTNETRRNQFTYEALQKLFAHYESVEEETGDQIEFDMIAICCEWIEYSSFQAIKEDYSSYDFKSIEEVEDYTTVLKTEAGTILIMEF